MAKCCSCYANKNCDIEFLFKRVVNGMFKYSYEMNADGKYVIPCDSLQDIIDTHITEDMSPFDIKLLVDEYGVFKAIKLYQDEGLEFNMDDLSFEKTYTLLSYFIINDYLNENDIACKEEEEKEEEEKEEDLLGDGCKKG